MNNRFSEIRNYRENKRREIAEQLRKEKLERSERIREENKKRLEQLKKQHEEFLTQTEEHIKADREKIEEVRENIEDMIPENKTDQLKFIDNSGSFNSQDYINSELKSHKILRIALLILCVIVSNLVTVIYSDPDSTISLITGDYTLTFKDLPIMLISGLFGYAPGMIVVFVAFIVKAFTDPTFAYTNFIYLVTVFVAGYFGKNKWYKSIKKTIAASAIMSFILGDVWYFNTMLVSGEGFSNFGFSYFYKYFMGTFPESLLCGLIIFFIFRGSTYIKILFPNGIYYTQYADEYKKAIKSRLSGKITNLILIESVLLMVASVCFVNYLLPTISSDMFTARPEFMGQEIGSSDFEADSKSNADTDFAVPDATDGTDNTTPEILPPGVGGISFDGNNHISDEDRDARFAYTYHGIAFDAKLIMLLLNVIVPIAYLSNLYAQLRISRPIIKMSRVMGRYSSMEKDDDMADMADDIHALRIRTGDEIEDLYHSIEKNSETTLGYVEFVKEKKNLESELEVAQKSSEAKSAFLSNMSHEIRTPINAIIGQNEMILREYDEPQLMEYASNINNASRNLLGIVNDILDSSKIESGKMEIICADYDLSSTVNDLVNMINVKAADKGLELIADVDPNLPKTLYGDDVRIKQCILNILTNAVKYTEEGSVKMTLKREDIDDENINLCVSVVDTGIGIKEEDLNKLFSRFERIEENRNRTIEGTGLGMSIVQNLLAMMDTHLNVKSVYGQGSDFSFKIKQKIIDNTPIGDYAKAYSLLTSSAEKYKESFHAPDAYVLIVDDTEMNLTVVKGLLKATAVKIETARSGEETLKLVVKDKFDMIFLDHRMPGMDGIETLEAMKGLEGNLNINTPVIALTANALSGARETYLSAGFDDFLSKPIDGSKLEALMIEHLPKEKVYLPESDEYDRTKVSFRNPYADISVMSGSGEVSKSGTYDFSIYEGIDVKQAIKNSGGEEILWSLIPQFRDNIKENSGLIEKYFNDKDLKNYGVYVHALKSSSRLIGALELSSLAAGMEECADKEDFEKINEKTHELLTLYRSYYDKLSGGDDSSENDKELIPEDELKDILSAIKEFALSFDYDGIDEAINALSGYRMPDDKKKMIEELKRRASNVETDAILKLLEDI